MPTTLAFWNCGLAPPAPGKPKRTPAEAADAVRLSFSRGADLVAVCEVDREAFNAMKGHLRSAGLALRSTNLTKQAGKRSFWDLGLLFGPTIRQIVPAHVLGEWEGQTVRVAARLSVQLSSGLHLRLYVAHWRSQIWSGASQRREAARQLRGKVTSDLVANVPVVVLADFNLEPFDENMVDGLATTRDPRLALRHPKEKLFNPTWGWAAPPSTNPWQPFGSIAYKHTRFLYDQALTSTHFLNESAGHAPYVRFIPPPPTQESDHDLLELTLP